MWNPAANPNAMGIRTDDGAAASTSPFEVAADNRRVASSELGKSSASLNRDGVSGPGLIARPVPGVAAPGNQPTIRAPATPIV